jgi:hypothetical protein
MSFEIGQRVVYNNRGKIYKTGYDAICLNDKVGVVVRERQNGDYGVYFEGWYHGHTCGQPRLSDHMKDSHYWVHPIFLTPIVPKLMSYEEML